MSFDFFRGMKKRTEELNQKAFENLAGQVEHGNVLDVIDAGLRLSAAGIDRSAVGLAHSALEGDPVGTAGRVVDLGMSAFGTAAYPAVGVGLSAINKAFPGKIFRKGE